MGRRRGFVGLRGELHGRARLTQEGVKWAREQWRSTGATVKELADTLGVERSTLRDAISGKTWGWLKRATDHQTTPNCSPTSPREHRCLSAAPKTSPAHETAALAKRRVANG